MKHKPNEWVSIADLMAGVVAVAMLLFVVAAMQIKENVGSLDAWDSCKELVRVTDRRSEGLKAQIVSKLEAIAGDIERHGLNSLIQVDSNEQKVTFTKNVFESGSACIDPKSSEMFAEVEEHVSRILQEIGQVEIYVDGHADADRAGHSTDLRKCAYYYDNYTLSAGRANEVRNILVRSLPDQKLKNRVIVTGYGDSRLVDESNPTSASNRRVELRFVLPHEPIRRQDPELFTRCLGPEQRPSDDSERPH